MLHTKPTHITSNCAYALKIMKLTRIHWVFQECADQGCSWRKYLLLATCILYSSQQNSKCFMASSLSCLSLFGSIRDSAMFLNSTLNGVHGGHPISNLGFSLNTLSLALSLSLYWVSEVPRLAIYRVICGQVQCKTRAQIKFVCLFRNPWR